MKSPLRVKSLHFSSFATVLVACLIGLLLICAISVVIGCSETEEGDAPSFDNTTTVRESGYQDGLEKGHEDGYGDETINSEPDYTGPEEDRYEYEEGYNEGYEEGLGQGRQEAIDDGSAEPQSEEEWANPTELQQEWLDQHQDELEDRSDQ